MQNQPPITPRLLEILQSLNNTPFETASPYEIVDLTYTKVFDFSYPIDSTVNKAELEKNILRHFLMRRIGLETYTYWKIKLIDKMHTLAPKYNLMFKVYDSITLSSGKVVKTEALYNSDNTTKLGSSTETIRGTKDVSKSESDNRVSDTPQTNIDEVKDGFYVSNYSYNQSEDSVEHSGADTVNNKGQDVFEHRGSDTTTTTETLSDIEKLEAFEKFNSSIASIYEAIYKDLDDLFLIF